MTEEQKKIHHKLAVDCFNSTWSFLDKKDRTPEDDADMIHTAHASRYHWGQIGTPLEFQRGGVCLQPSEVPRPGHRYAGSRS